MTLTYVRVRGAEPKDKPFKLTDERGLYLLVKPNGGKYWRFKYRFDGKEKLLALGVYPDVSLAVARERRDQARTAVASGVDPGAARQAALVAVENTFEAVAREWFARFSVRWAPGHADKVLHRLEADLFPWLGQRPIAEIKAPELLAVLRRVESRGALDTAHRAHQNAGAVFRYAVATGRAERDPSGDLRGALPPTRKQHYPTITDTKAIGDLLQAIDGYEGSNATRCALKLAPLLFVRPGELRQAEWAEIDLDRAEWRIPAAKMKMRAQHIVPLSKQALATLEELRPLTGNGRYLFPGERTDARPMSANTVNAALRRLGYAKEDMTGHGFRAMASTILNEQGWSPDVIERQLAHAERDGVRAAYNHAQYLPDRRKMMQAWADFLDGLAAGAQVIPLHRRA